MKKKKPMPANKDRSFYVSCATDKLFSQKAHTRSRLHIGATLVNSRSRRRRRRRSPCLQTKIDHFMRLVPLCATCKPFAWTDIISVIVVLRKIAKHMHWQPNNCFLQQKKLLFYIPSRFKKYHKSYTNKWYFWYPYIKIGICVVCLDVPMP
jgi:hypothetical protein